jgi:hypothetical protein
MATVVSQETVASKGPHGTGGSSPSGPRVGASRVAIVDFDGS